jgi:hyperosmotically inducible protein
MYARWRNTKLVFGMVLPLFLCGAAQLGLAASDGAIPDTRLSLQSTTLAAKVRNQLAGLPYYDVFDYVTFSIVAPNTVVLTGEVTRPALRSDAETAVRDIAGVKKVEDTIEVLPASPTDDAIRWAVFKAIFEKPGLQVYATQPVSPLRIIVKNGRLTLDGMVASKFDRTLIEATTREVPGVVNVKDNLVVG